MLRRPDYGAGVGEEREAGGSAYLRSYGTVQITVLPVVDEDESAGGLDWEILGGKW